MNIENMIIDRISGEIEMLRLPEELIARIKKDIDQVQLI